MAEAFLSNLQNVARGVLREDEQQCSICMQAYGTTPSENGIIERPIRLPCNHVMGSECIAIWVSSSVPGGTVNNNTCPICRQVLFHSTPIYAWPAVDYTTQAEVLDRCAEISAELELSFEVRGMAKSIAANAHYLISRWAIFSDRLKIPIAAASVCMASYLLRQGHPLRSIWACVEDQVEFDAIRTAYLALFEIRVDIISAQLLAIAGYEDAASIDEVIPSSQSSEIN